MGRMIRFFTILFLLSVSCFAQVKQWHLTNTSANVQLQLDNRVMRVSTLAALKALPAVQVASGALVSTAGYTTAGDGGGALYRYDGSSTATANDGSVILPTHGTGRYVLAEAIQSFLQWGVVAGSTSAASNNAVRMQAALVALKDGGHIMLPRLTQTVYVGPNPVRPGVHMTNVTIELHGQLHVPDSPVWYHSSNPGSLFHFSDAGSYNNIRITGSAVINGNATNQTVATTNSYNFGKQFGIRIDYATNVVIEGITLRNFGFFALGVGYASDVKVRDLSIYQTGGNNDTLPSRYGANCDGIHFVNSKDVTISGCHIESTDDCIAFTQTDVAGVISTNIVVTGNVLRPYSTAPGFVPSAFRLGLEPGVSNGAIRDVLFANNVIKPVAANGAYIGSAITDQPRSISRIKIIGNIFQDVQSSDVIVIGPNAGTANTAGILTGGVTALNADDVEVSENLFQNVRSHAIMAGNVGRMRIFGNTITNIIDNTGGTEARGVGVYVSHGLYGDVDELIVENNEFSGLDGGAIVGSGGSTYEIKTLRVRGNTFERWLRGLYSSAGRTHPAILSSRARTNVITDNVFRGGEGSGIVIGSAFATVNEISRNTFAYFTQTAGSGVGGVEWVRVTNPGGAVAGSTYLKGNRFGSTPSRFANLINVANIYITDNDFTPHEIIASVPVADSILVDYASGTSGNATLAVKGNFVHIENKLGANPQQFVRTYNNLGSGGSSVALTTILDGNVFTPQSGMVPIIDAFAGGAREIAYAATVTITNYTINPLRLRVGLSGNMTLAWSNPFPGQRGTLDVYPDTVARVITLPSLAYSPTGSTITNSGGTGSTNWTRLNWEVHQVGGTNRIFVQPTEVYR